MNRIEFHSKAHAYLAILIAFCLPFARLTPVFIALLLLNWLIEGDFKNKFQLILKNKFALLFLGFFMMHLLGMLYTSNVDAGLFDLQVKLSLFIFPIVIASRPYTQEQVRNIFFVFIIGGVLASLLLLTRATYTWFALSENNFFYQAFSFLLHPSYLSMYLNVAIAWLLLNLFKKSEFPSRFSTLLSVLIVLFFTGIIILLSSKMGLISLVLLFVGFTIYLIISKKRYLIGGAALILILASVVSLVQFVPEIGDRVKNAIHAIANPPKDNSELESTAVRMLIWKAANTVIAENLVFGAGTGDGKDALIQEYKNREMVGAYEHTLNAHNQFYQVTVSLGIIGLMLLLFCLLLPLLGRYQTPSAIYVLFLLIIIFNFIPESMLEVQAGVMFYAFFNSLLCFCTNFVPDKSNRL
jgi:O-antigen ligase